MTDGPNPSREIPPAPLQDSDDEGRPGLVREFFLFLKENKKWWLLPMVIVFLALGAAMLATHTPLAPFIYTLM